MKRKYYLQNENQKTPKISIIFVNWNTKKYSFDLIESLNNISYKNYEIIVIDNNSKENIETDFKKKYSKNKKLTLIKNKDNLGLAEGTNVGIREGLKRDSKYILVMNNDMYVKKNFLKILVEAMEKHPEVSVAGPKIYYMEPKNMIWCAGCDYHFSGYKPRRQKQIDKDFEEKERYVDALDCVLIFRSDVLKKQGLLDKDLFLVHEFTGWCLRTRNLGYKCLYVPKSKVWHKVEASLKGNKKESEISTYYNVRNWLLVIKKNTNIFYYFWILFLQSTLLATYRIFKYIRSGQPKLIKTYFVAVWHAIINKTPLKLYPYEKN